MNCPLCDLPMEEIPNETYDRYPGYSCANFTQNEHYSKYYTASWSYAHYVETATFKDYQIVNLYNHISGRPNIGIIKKYTKSLNILNQEIHSYESIFRIQRIIPIPPMDKFLNKIKTILIIS